MYISVEDTNTYFATRYPIPGEWISASNDLRTRVLITASRFLDCLRYKGIKGDGEHEFPRLGQSEIPSEMRFACAEIAEMLLEGTDPEKEFETLSISSENIASAGVTYDHVAENQAAGIPSAVAWRFIYPWLDTNRIVKISRVD